MITISVLCCHVQRRWNQEAEDIRDLRAQIHWIPEWIGGIEQEAVFGVSETSRRRERKLENFE